MARLASIWNRLFVFVLFSCCFLYGQTRPLQGFDAYVTKALRDWGCPGLAVAAVKDDKMVLAKGYGVRKLGESAAVDEHTLFGIASCSKAFTATALGMLVDEGKIRWDDRAIEYLPGFELHDPYVTREITIRDLLCHRSGLPAFGGDLMWWGSTRETKEILERARNVGPVSSFRSKYAYQNIMFIAAGAVIPAATEKSWSDFVAERILTPLGMNSSLTKMPAPGQVDNLATPHKRIDGKTKPIAWRNTDNGAGAVGVNSNVLDMARWIRLQLGRGVFEGKRLYSADVAQEMWSPQTIVPISHPTSPLPPFLKPRWSAYGLGWGISEFRGNVVVRHYGETDGMSSVVALMPEKNLGVVILANLHTTSLHTALLYRIFDAFLGATPEDWSTLYLKVRTNEELKEREEYKKREEARVKTSVPSLPLNNYAGTYQHALYGEAAVAEEDGKLVVRLSSSPSYVADLEHWQFDIFLSRWRDPVAGTTYVSFTLNSRGTVDEMRVKVDSYIDPGEYTFKKK